MPLARRAAALLLLCGLAVACHRSSQFAAVGEVETIDRSHDRIVIRHAEIPGALGAASTAFAVATPDLLQRASAGMRVRFEFRRTGSQDVITSLTPAGEGRPGVHDHTPHHGGVVAMAGMIHLEAVASADGEVRLYVSDIWRRPLPPADVHGTVTIGSPGARQTLTLVPTADASIARAAAPTAPTVHARFEVTVRGQAPIDLNFVLPVARDAGGAAGVPLNGCEPPAARVGMPPDAQTPRCTLHFPRSITAVAVTPDGATALVAAVDLGVSAWRLPVGQLVRGFEAPAPITIPTSEAPHPESVYAMAVRPDATQVLVAIENRLLCYSIATGKLVRELNWGRGIIRGVAWSPSGDALLVTAFYDPAAHLLSAADGRELRRFEVEREGAAVAFAPDAKLIAVSSEVGPITFFDPASGVPTRQLQGLRRTVQSMEFRDDRLVTASDDGRLQLWEVSSGRLVNEDVREQPFGRLALAPGRPLAAAVSGARIVVYDLQRPAVAEVLEWHAAPILALAWSSSGLISGDAAGDLALWDDAPH